jgi:hypothetical protein
VPDPRVQGKITHELPTALTGLVTGMVTNARSLRGVEQRTAEIAKKHGAWQGIKKRIGDNTLGRIIKRIRLVALLACLHRLIKAEQRRGNLKPTVLPIGTVAIDGKNVGTLRWGDLCRALDLEPEKATVARVRKGLAERYPKAQLCVPKEGEPYALLRVHTVTLISADAAPCIHQRPIEGDTNEVGAMPRLIDELCEAYRRTKLFRLVTTDAGNTSLGSANKLVEHGLGYFAQIKSIHGELHAEARRSLGERRPSRAPQRYSDQQNGKTATYYAWSCELGEQGWLDWTHARQLVRVRRVVQDPSTGDVISTGDRYYVTSLPSQELGLRTAMDISRAHWRCENCTHWSADAEWQEDRRQLAWSRHPNGVLAVSLLQRMALAILTVVRQLSRIGYSQETPTWSQVIGHFLLVLCDSILDTTAFDEV